MEAIRAERGMDPAEPRVLSTPYGDLDRRQVAELSAPGAAIGLLGGVIAGGLLAISGLSLPITLVAGVLLAVPLAVAGAVYEILLAKGKIPMGTRRRRRDGLGGRLAAHPRRPRRGRRPDRRQRHRDARTASSGSSCTR